MCSGIGAPEVAAPWVDWRLASEIENFPRAVLQERHGYKPPDDHNQGDPLLWGDMTEVTPELARAHGVPLPDVLVAGTPCQAFSVAGLRKGTDDARGNLTLKFVETCHAIVNDQHDGRLAVLWENVPGVLSDKGNAFGCFLGGLVGADDALPSPDGGSWPSVGMVSGPRSRAAWRVLDAQYFGVAQRRRRVFVVVDFGGAVDPAAVLFERQGLRGNTAPSRQAGEGVAGTVTARTCRSVGAQDADNGHLICADVAPTLNAHFGDKMGLENQHINGGCGMFVTETETMIAHSLRGEGFDASEDGTGRGTPLVPEIAQTLTSNGDAHSGFREDCGLVATPWAVRRLIPNECHSLQGFPQDYCAITYRNKPAADGPQYKALGNSMAVPVIAWIMDRIRTSAAQKKAAA
jgi:DNA (cytosine-5)-methyltransferase 1